MHAVHFLLKLSLLVLLAMLSLAPGHCRCLLYLAGSLLHSRPRHVCCMLPFQALLPLALESIHVCRSSCVMLSMRNKTVQLNHVFLLPRMPIMFHLDRRTHRQTDTQSDELLLNNQMWGSLMLAPNYVLLHKKYTWQIRLYILTSLLYF